MTQKSNVKFASGKRFVESMRHQGLSASDAIKELIDNSLDASADNIYIDVWSENSGKINIMIQDDGVGMAKDLLESAPAFGQSDNNDRSKIGRFGFGMPTAIPSMTRNADVFSNKKDRWLYTYLDLDEIAEDPEMRLPSVIEKSPKDLYGERVIVKNGTIVVMKECDRLDYKNAETIANHAKQELQETYRIFLSEGRKIILNRELLKPKDPLMVMKNHLYAEDLRKGLPKEKMTDNSGYGEQIGDIENICVEYIDEKGVTQKGYVRIKLVLLPIEDIRRTGGAPKYGIGYETQGFYLMRNKRQIAGKQTLDVYARHPMFTHFRGEIDFDAVLDQEFGVQVNKSRFSLTKSMKDKIKERVKSLLPSIRSKQYDIMHELTDRADDKQGLAEEIARDNPYPKPKQVKTATEKDSEQALKQEIMKITKDTGLDEETKEKIRQSLTENFEKQMPFYTDTENMRQGPIFAWEYLGKTTKVIVNREHPFYKYVWLPMSKNLYSKTVLKMLIYTLVKGEQLHKETLQDGNNITHEELQNFWSQIMRKYLLSEKFSEFYDNQGFKEEDY